MEMWCEKMFVCVNRLWPLFIAEPTVCSAGFDQGPAVMSQIEADI